MSKKYKNIAENLLGLWTLGSIIDRFFFKESKISKIVLAIIAVLFLIALGMVIYSERRENGLTLWGVIRKYKVDVLVFIMPLVTVLLLALILSLIA